MRSSSSSSSSSERNNVDFDPEALVVKTEPHPEARLSSKNGHDHRDGRSAPRPFQTLLVWPAASTPGHGPLHLPWRHDCQVLRRLSRNGEHICTRR